MSQTKLTDLLQGIQEAIAQAMQHIEMQHTIILRKYFDIDEENNRIVAKTISMEIPSRDKSLSNKENINVPLISLIPIRSLRIEEISVDFEARISGVEMKEMPKASQTKKQSGANEKEQSIGSGYVASTSNLSSEIYIEMKNHKFLSSSTPAKISIKFKDSDPPEGIVRVSEHILNEIK